MKPKYVLHGSEVCYVLSLEKDQHNQDSPGTVEFYSEAQNRSFFRKLDGLVVIPEMSFKNVTLPLTTVRQGMMVHIDGSFFFVKNIHKTKTGRYAIKVDDNFGTFYFPEDLEIIQ